MINKDAIVDRKPAKIFSEGPDIVIQFSDHPFKQNMRLKLTPQEFLDLSHAMERVRYSVAQMITEQAEAREAFRLLTELPTPHLASHCR